MDDLEERLKNHARAFEGIMSLIPAKHYYGEDTSDQWQRKKQTKEEKKAARRAKLNPNSSKSALDVMEENERKRKREMEEGDDTDVDAPGKEKPKEGMKVKKPKKVKLNHDDPNLANAAPPEGPTSENAVSKRKTKLEKRKEKQQRKREKDLELQQKVKGKAAHTEQQATNGNEAADNIKDVSQSTQDDVPEPEVGPEKVVELDLSLTADEPKEASASSATPSPIRDTPLSPESVNRPASSSTSSIIPPSTGEEHDKPTKGIKIPKIDPQILRERLQARIDALRAARKADGIDGKPARNRQELIEARRRKQEQRQQHKKELRAQAKESQRAAAEAELARLRGSGSPTSLDLFSPRREEVENNFSFGRVAFDGGQQMDPCLSAFRDPRKVKGPQDPRTALEAAQKKAARINGLDEQKKTEIEEKELWLNAKKRAHGEKVRDDTSLLKKTLKRKEKGKQKSEKEWNNRLEGVKRAKEGRQKKREENLRKRKEEKGAKGGKGGKAKKAGKKPKGRPGFEGSFRAKPR